MIRYRRGFPRTGTVGPRRRRFHRTRMVGPRGRRLSRPARTVTPRRRRLVVMGWRFVTFRRRRRSRRIAWHIARAAGESRCAVDAVIRIERPANARSGIAPPARAFGVVGSQGRTRRVGGVVRAPIGHGGGRCRIVIAQCGVAPLVGQAFGVIRIQGRTRGVGRVVRAQVRRNRSLIDRNRLERKRGVVQAVGSEREADHHGSRPRGPCDDANRMCVFRWETWPVRSWDHSL